ncbi:MAG: type IX secretion system sortase PorU [Cyclobacteriaceae bacterium]
MLSVYHHFIKIILAAWRGATGLSVSSPRGARRTTAGFPLLSLAGSPLRFKLVTTFCFLQIFLSQAQVNSVLSSGEWYKFSVQSDGVFKINYDLLKKAGINPDQIDPRNIRLYTGSTGMLPQPNSKPRLQDLAEIAISVSGEADGTFNKEDFVLFFGQGPDLYSYNTQKEIFEYENNQFTDKNFYFLTISSSSGKRIAISENVAGSFPLVQEFDDFAFYETEKTNLLKSGRQWFGEQFDNITEATVRFDIPGVIDNSKIKFTSHVMAQSISDCSFKILYNNSPILDQPIAAVPNTTYAIKGRITTDTISLNAGTVKASSQNAQEIKYQFTKGTTPGISVGYLDYFLFAIKRKLALYGDQTIFTSSKSLGNPISSFEVASANSNTILWDITDPRNTAAQSFQFNEDKLVFSTSSARLKKLTAFNPDKSASPNFELKINNQNLHALSPTQLIIITHPDFEKEADRLASHRQSKSGVSASVVTTEEVYNEYSGGKQDLTAIRDFVRDQYKKPGSTLKNVLLFGRGSYDYKNRVFNNTNFVPIYESVNSLGPLETYSSDDYFGMLKDADGAWTESPSQNSTMDIGVGRIPIKKIEEAKAVVNKLIEYDLAPEAGGRWRKDFLFVADDGDFNIHQSQSDQIANSIDVTNPEFDVKKLFLDSFNQIERNTGPFSPDAAKALDLAVRAGQAIVNYTGHGSEKVWMQEQALTETIILNWKNSPQYPLFVTATCEFGRNDDPFIISSGERIILQPKGGGIGLVTTARPVNSSTNFTLNKAFYAALFSKENNQFRDLGSIFRETKNTSLSGVANRNFSLLGDPSMKLAFGNNQVAVDEILTSTGSSTLKGLSSVTIKGQIKSNGSLANSFTGEVQATLFDKPLSLTTKGTESSPFTYSQWSNLLFKGKSSITNGKFHIDFVMPTNVSSQIDKGKLSLYARSNSGQDALGASANFLIGGFEPAPPTDTTPPEIKLFLGDTTFAPGGLVGPNTKLIARLSDNSGINISLWNPTKNITATLDNKQSFIINDYYVSDKDNFKSGFVIYPLDTLKKGKHTLFLSASDTYNNSSSKNIDFTVSDGSQIQIEQFANFPNPVVSSTQFWFTHSRPGEDLQATITLYDIAGQVILSQDYEIAESQYQVALPEWNGEAPEERKLGNGLYLAKLFIRSMQDGSNNERIAKFIIMN